MKLCKDCKHLEGDFYCKISANKRIDMVTGKVTYLGPSNARAMRETTCGEEAKLFEKRSLLSKVDFELLAVISLIILTISVTVLGILVVIQRILS